MALSETIEYDKIEVVGKYKAVQVRKATVIKKDGVELTRAYERYVLHPDTDLSQRSEPKPNPFGKLAAPVSPKRPVRINECQLLLALLG